MGQRNVVIDWDLPTPAEWERMVNPLIVEIDERANRQEAYYLALRLVQRLDPHRDRNTAWRIGGRWCWTLDEAVRAILGEAE